MTEKTYRQAFEQARKDLAEAIETKKRASEEVAAAEEAAIQLRRAITALATLLNENVEDSMGLTEAVRTVAVTEAWWTAKMFIDRVQGIGASLTDLKNPEASMLSVLNRLTAAGELESGNGTVGKEKVKIWRKRAADSTMTELTDDEVPF